MILDILAAIFIAINGAGIGWMLHKFLRLCHQMDLLIAAKRAEAELEEEREYEA